jgi:hypothetical protein
VANLARRKGRAEGERGQALLEFTLIAPVFFLVVFGAFDFGLMMFTIGSARFAAADAARVEALVGDSPGLNACKATCFRLGLGQGSPANNCNADCQAAVAINESSLLTSSFARILEVDVIKQTLNADGSLTDSSTVNKYQGNGQLCSPFTVNYPNGSFRTYCTPASSNYSPGRRNAFFGQMDYLKIDIVYEYDWKTGLLFSVFPQPPELHASYTVQLEPKSYP